MVGGTNSLTFDLIVRKMEYNQIVRELRSQGHEVGTKITLIRQSRYLPNHGPIIDYHVGRDIDWAKQRIAQLATDGKPYLFQIKVLGMTRIREQKSKYGEKRRRAGGHGYEGWDGYIQI
jgi:uncharacterized NAD(P)/FAD-binding protein YdhS